jgi:hypothetical protein
MTDIYPPEQALAEFEEQTELLSEEMRSLLDGRQNMSPDEFDKALKQLEKSIKLWRWLWDELKYARQRAK